MAEEDNGNVIENLEEEEEIEENGNINQIQEEYEEEMDNQANDEDNPVFEVAFDIQMNEGSFILLVGKTEQKQLIMRLVDKEDENKPFYQNEFSLDELKELNHFFKNFKTESEAIDCIIKNLNESEKEIVIMDENNIKLSIYLSEVTNSKIDFLLIKHQYVIESDEQEQEYENENENEHEQDQDKEEQIQNDQDQEENINNNMNKQNIVREDRILNKDDNMHDVNEEIVEEVENEDNDNTEHIEDNLEYSEENNEKSDKKNNNINIILNISPFKNISKNLQNENALHTIIEEVNENTLISPESTQTKDQIKEIKILNDSNKQNNVNEKVINNFSEKDKVKENDNPVSDMKISKVIEELKDNLDSLGGAMNFIDQDDEEQEQNTNENEVNKGKNEDYNFFKNELLKTITALSNNFNNQLQKQNEYFVKMEKSIRDDHDKKIQEIKNELNKKDNQINDMKNVLNNILNEKISFLEQRINEFDFNGNKDKDNKSSNQKQDNNKQNKEIINTNNINIEKIKNDLNLKIKEIEQKINNLTKNNNESNNGTNIDNSNIKELMEKINDIENKIKQNDSNSQNNNNITNNLENKIKNIEKKIKNIEGKKSDKDKKVLYNKIVNLENQSKIFENKLNNLGKTGGTVVSEGHNEEILEKINSLEELINNIKDKKKKSDIHIKKSVEELNNNDIINKVNNLMKWTKSYESEIQNLENELKNTDNYLNNMEKRIKKLENKNVSKQSNDINKNDIPEKVIINTILESNNEPRRINAKKVKKSKNHQIKHKDAENKEKINKSTKNYRVIKNIDEKFDDNNNNNNKYMSNTFNKGGITNSHSVNRFEIKQDNYLDKSNNIEYEIVTRPRSKSKEHKRNMPQQDIFYDNQSTKSIKYRDSNPPIPKEYENSITESRIVEYDDITFIENRIKEIYPKLNIDFNLVYRATDDGDKARDFHRKCDKIGPNVTFVKTKKDYVFGGFTVKNWEHLKRDINEKKPNLGSASRDARAFGFCVNNQRIYNNVRPDEFAIWCNRNFGATFKNNFFQIFDNCFKKGGYCSKKDNSHFGGQEYDYEISGGESKFAIDDIEVYEILFQ